MNNTDIPTPAVSIGILAGGGSSRMGTNKALLPFDGVPFIERIAKAFGDFPERLISAAHPGEYKYLGLPVCCDEQRGIGPIEGIRQLLRAARNDYVFVCAADMIFLRKEVPLYLARFICPEIDCYVISCGGYLEPLCAIYSKRILPTLDAQIAQGRYSIREIYRTHPTKFIPLESSGFDQTVLQNINTPEDYKSALDFR